MLHVSAAAGMPVFGSSSGNGFHALFRVAGDEYEKAKFCQLALGPGLAADVFLPGARFLVVLRLENVRFNAEPDARIPVLDRQGVRNLLLWGKPAADQATG